ncbi:hypothetical protein C8Q80DRAFT_191293 [Daedaleopsis nitida]|nr:hypothetical protein C8Q80DRAFT_191293 [Daedaleopsis nitida]
MCALPPGVSVVVVSWVFCCSAVSRPKSAVLHTHVPIICTSHKTRIADCVHQINEPLVSYPYVWCLPAPRRAPRSPTRPQDHVSLPIATLQRQGRRMKLHARLVQAPGISREGRFEWVGGSNARVSAH